MPNDQYDVAPVAKSIMNKYPKTCPARHLKMYNLINKLKQKMNFYKKKVYHDQFPTIFKAFLRTQLSIPVSVPKKQTSSVAVSMTQDRALDTIGLNSNKVVSPMLSSALSTSSTMPPGPIDSVDSVQQILKMPISEEYNIHSQSKCEGCKELCREFREVIKEKLDARRRHVKRTKLLGKQFKKLFNLTRAQEKLKKYKETNENLQKIVLNEQLQEKIRILETNLEKSNECYRILVDKYTIMSAKLIDLENNQSIKMADEEIW